MSASFVNSASNKATSAPAYDIVLPSLLEGDLVVVGYGISNAADADMLVNTSGYTEVVELYADDTHDTNLAVAYKFMGATPDTVVNVKGPSSVNRGGAGVVQIWRGIDPSTPLDVTAVSVTGSNSATPDPGSITPVTVGSVILAFAAVSGVASDDTGTAPAGYSNLVASSISGTVDSLTVMAASKIWSSGAENPGTFTDFAVDGGSPASCSWAAITLALRPLAVDIELVQTSRFDNSKTFFGGSVFKFQGINQSARFNHIKVFFGGVVSQPSLLSITQYERFNHLKVFFDGAVQQQSALAITQTARFDKSKTFFGGTVSEVSISTAIFNQKPVDGLYIDLKISGNDLLLNPGGEPALLDDRDSVAQDILHLIRESGLMVQLIGQRNSIIVKSNLQDLELLIEDDVRLIPGTIKITPLDNELYVVSADTFQFGPIEFYIGF